MSVKKCDLSTTLHRIFFVVISHHILSDIAKKRRPVKSSDKRASISRQTYIAIVATKELIPQNQPFYLLIEELEPLLEPENISICTLEDL